VKKKPKKVDGDDLRRRAEEQLRAREATHRGSGSKGQMIHELEVHQIELEIQNEELLAARTDLELGLARYTELFDFAPIGYLVIDALGTIRELNLSGAELFGIERQRLVNRRFALFVPDHQRRGFAELLAKVLAQPPDDRRSETCELTLLHDAGTPREVRVTMAMIGDNVPTAMVAVEDITPRTRAEAAARAEQAERERLYAETRRDLELSRRLHEIAMLFLPEASDLQVVFGKIVETAIAIADSDFGNLQIVDPTTGALKIIAHRGLPAWWIDFWNHGERTGACRIAFDRAERVIVEDIEQSPIFAGKALAVQREVGVRAIVSTPLVSRAGQTIGMFSTHSKTPGRPDEHALRLLDLLARLSADLIERTRFEEREAALRRRFEVLDHISVMLSRHLTAHVDAPVPDELLRAIAEQARAVCAADAAAIGLGENHDALVDRWIVVAPSRGLGERSMVLFERSARLLHETIERTVRSNDRDGSIAAVAITDRNGPVCCLCVANPSATAGFDEDDQLTLEMLAERIANALEVTRLAHETHDAVRARENLLAVVSHDLRTPLSAIKLSAHAMVSGDQVGPERRRSRRQVDIILRSTERMGRLIEDLVQAASIESGKFAVQVTSIEVRPLIEEAIQILDPIASASSVHLDYAVGDDVPPIEADRQRVMQVLSNVVGNATKFVGEGGSIHVHVSLRGSAVVFAIADTGPGIPDEELARIFERYERGRAGGRHGVGLGLYIAKGIVEAHRGRMWVESHVGVGTTFYFSIPIAETAEQHAPIS
jgi:PAS domain S-box-containing protein